MPFTPWDFEVRMIDERCLRKLHPVAQPAVSLGEKNNNIIPTLPTAVASKYWFLTCISTSWPRHPDPFFNKALGYQYL